MTIAELGRGFRTGELSPVEVTKQAIAQAERLQPKLNAFISLLADSALMQARASEERFARQAPLGPLDGIPVGVKDLIHVEAVRTTAGSKIMASYLAAKDAEVIRRLRAGGAVVLGKTNLHEFAYGATGDVSHFGPVHNPWQLDHITGGSSSGSGAAVAAGICPMALGSDTGGSIRIPAAMCGVVGLKPTYGRVSNEGVVPLAWSLDHVGPLTATVEDAGLSLQAMSDFRLPALEPGGSGFRVGVCRNFFFEHLHAEVRRLVESALPLAGELREVHIPHANLFPDVATVVISSESMTFHRNWLRERPEDYDQSVRFRLEGAQET
ncbi:MAG: amidase, partial [Chloroflexota bacterium]|nr:amidase [Chloroflexota bacterium]